MLQSVSYLVYCPQIVENKRFQLLEMRNGRSDYCYKIDVRFHTVYKHVLFFDSCNPPSCLGTIDDVGKG